MVGPEILFAIYQCFFFEGFCAKWLHKAVSKPTIHASAKLCRSRRDGRWPHLACSMDVIVSKFALLEAEFLLGRPVTIVRDTSAIDSARSWMIQSMCISVW